MRWIALLLCLARVSFGASATVTWDPNPEPDVIGYHVLYGTSPGVYTTSLPSVTTTARIVGLLPGTTYYFAVTARNEAQFESPPSVEVAWNAPVYVPGVFIKGINVNGPALTANGQAWVAGTAANGFSTSGAPFTDARVYSPPVDASTNTMLGTGVWCSICDMTLSQALPSGEYAVYLWTIEDYLDNYRTYNVEIEGAQVASAIGRMPKFTWTRYGPYYATVTDGALSVLLQRITGDPVMQGVEIWSAVPASTGPQPPTQLHIPAPPAVNKKDTK